MLKKITLIGFVLMVTVQLFVPVKMIIDSNRILTSGQIFKFKTMPVDPKDPFRGNYVNLGFDMEIYTPYEGMNWSEGEQLYALIGEDENGYAQIAQLTSDKPLHPTAYIKVRTLSGFEVGVNTTLRLELPFRKYFMQEEKAPIAEQIYRESLGNSSTVAYALVRVLNGEGILQDVLIDGVSLRDLAERRLEVE